MNDGFTLPAKTSAPCFDAGSPYCPCDLAFLAQCVQCSLIRGEETCRCGWSGVCVYADFVRSKKAAPARDAVPAPVLSRTGIVRSPDRRGAFILDLGLADHVLRWCVFPGSFFMVRPKGLGPEYNVALSVMRVHDDGVEFAVEVVGPKTIALSLNCRPGREVVVTGPYWSGLQGSATLRRHAGGRALVIAKGIGQAPALNTVRYLKSRGYHVKALLGPGYLGEVFAGGLLGDEGATVEVLPRSKDHNIARFYQELWEGAFDVLVSEGGDRQHRSLLDLCASMENPPALAWSSNLTMVCAEGICGSCLVSGHRGCKADLDPAALGT